MFALELNFHDGVSPTEIIFVRRAQAVIGSSDFAHVVIEADNRPVSDVRVTRGVGRSFRTQLVRPGDSAGAPELQHQAEAELNLGGVTARLTSLDIDLMLKEGESADAAGVRILREAVSRNTPVFPAVAVAGAVPVFMSFPADQQLMIGRSRFCHLRLDSSEVTSEHARIGYDNKAFWVEDLGSTNGTFVDDGERERISGRRVLAGDEVVIVGSEITIVPLASAEDIGKLSGRRGRADEVAPARTRYPVIISNSPDVKPSRLPLTVGKTISFGREPSNDIWIAAPHISRRHAEVTLRKDGYVDYLDLSSNGSFIRGQRVPTDEVQQLPDEYTVIDLNNGIQLALCFSEEDEERGVGGSTSEHEEQLPANLLTHIISRDAIADVNLDEETVEPPPASILAAEEYSDEVDDFRPLDFGEESEPQGQIDRRNWFQPSDEQEYTTEGIPELEEALVDERPKISWFIPIAALLILLLFAVIFVDFSQFGFGG